MKTTPRINHGLSNGHDPCLWMQAGVVARKDCLLDYECPACQFDRALRRTARENAAIMKQGGRVNPKREKIVFWQDRLKELPVSKRPCLHHLKRRIAFRACTHDYHCSDCEFDQYFHDQYTVFAVVKPVDVLDVHGIRFPQGYYLHPGHTWAKIEEGSMIRVGMDDFALRVFGKPDKVQAPLVGKTVSQDRNAIEIQRGNHRADVLSPVSGVVTDVNPSFRENAQKALKNPYSDGWIMRVHSESLRQDLKSLRLGDETKEMLKKDMRRLYNLIEETAGPLAADGGELAHDLFGAMPALGWRRLTRLFLAKNR